jgi:hypothetical protein
LHPAADRSCWGKYFIGGTIVKHLLLAGAIGMLLTCRPVWAAEPEPVQFTVIHFNGIDANEVVRAVRDRYKFGIARLPLFDSLLVWGTAEDLARAQNILSH